MKARRDDGEPAQPEVEAKNKKKATEGKKKPAINRHRLANVIFSESVRPAVLPFGKALKKNDLESNLETNQKVYELVASEYNKGEVKDYSELYFDIQVLPKNLPSNFSAIEWKDVKLAWNESLYQVAELLSNQTLSGKNEPSDDEDDVINGVLSSYVGCWYRFRELYPNLFIEMCRV
jgi:hypothetical protein